MMLNANAMTMMSSTTISIASVFIATNNMTLPVSFLFVALCQVWEQPMHLKGFLVEKTEMIWWESSPSYAKRGNSI